MSKSRRDAYVDAVEALGERALLFAALVEGEMALPCLSYFCKVEGMDSSPAVVLSDDLWSAWDGGAKEVNRDVGVVSDLGATEDWNCKVERWMSFLPVAVFETVCGDAPGRRKLYDCCELVDAISDFVNRRLAGSPVSETGAVVREQVLVYLMSPEDSDVGPIRAAARMVGDGLVNDYRQGWAQGRG